MGRNHKGHKCSLPVYTFMTFGKHNYVSTKRWWIFFSLNTHWFAQKRYFKIQLANLVNLMRHGGGWCGTHDIFGCLEGLQAVWNPGWTHTHLHSRPFSLSFYPFLPPLFLCYSGSKPGLCAWGWMFYLNCSQSSILFVKVLYCLQTQRCPELWFQSSRGTRHCEVKSQVVQTPYNMTYSKRREGQHIQDC